MSLYFYSDPHFGHAAVLSLSERPFASIAEHDAFLIDRYSHYVSAADTVYWLGDVAFCSRDRAREIVSGLPGKKILVRGNHDRGPGAMAALGFDLVADRLTMQIADHTAVLCHYPYRAGVREGDDRTFDYPQPTKGWVLVHGHTHSRRRRNGVQIHVGVDAWNYGLARLHDVEELVWEAFR